MTQIRATPRWPAQPQVRPNAQGGASGFPNMQGPFRTAPRAPGAQPGSMRNALSARPITGIERNIVKLKEYFVTVFWNYVMQKKFANLVSRVISEVLEEDWSI
jgi:hypothetical protein